MVDYGNYAGLDLRKHQPKLLMTPLYRIVGILVFASFFPLAQSSIARDPLEETVKWKLDQAMENDLFGFDIAKSGNLMVAGAPGRNGESGAAFLLNAITGEEVETLLPTHVEAESYFGVRVAMDGDFVAIAAPLEDGDGTDQGAVYLFNLDSGETKRLFAEDAGDGDWFGISLAIERNLLLIGAHQADGEGDDRGAVYIYDMEAKEFTGKLTAPDAEDGDEFGSSIALLGKFVAVGAPGEDGGEDESDRGAGYLFNVLTGEFLYKVVPSGPDLREANFGGSCFLSDEILAFGASSELFTEEGDDTYYRGAVYIFDLLTGEELLRLQPEDTGDDDKFGSAIAISDDLILISGVQSDDGEVEWAGAAWLYDYESGRELRRIKASDGGQDHQLGASIILEGRRAAISAPLEDPNPENATGAVYWFDFSPRPDALIGESRAALRGDDRYNSNGSGQRIRQRSSRRMRSFFRAENDGSINDRLRVRSRRNTAKFRYQHRKLTGGGANVTGAVASGRYLTPELFPEERVDFRTTATPRGRSNRNRRENVRTVIRSTEAAMADVVKNTLVAPRDR